MHSSNTEIFQAKLRIFPDNPKKEIPGISQLETNQKEIKMECLTYNEKTRCDKFINPRSYLQITELDHNQGLHNPRHKEFIWQTNSR